MYRERVSSNRGESKRTVIQKMILTTEPQIGILRGVMCCAHEGKEEGNVLYGFVSKISSHRI